MDLERRSLSFFLVREHFISFLCLAHDYVALILEHHRERVSIAVALLARPNTLRA